MLFKKEKNKVYKNVEASDFKLKAQKQYFWLFWGNIPNIQFLVKHFCPILHERGRLLGGCPWNIFIWMIWKIDITEGLNASLIYQSFKTQLQHLICPFWEISLKPVSFWYHITILMVKNWSRFMKNCKIWPLQSSYRISLDISKWESHFLLTLFLKKKKKEFNEVFFSVQTLLKPTMVGGTSVLLDHSPIHKYLLLKILFKIGNVFLFQRHGWRCAQCK